MAEYTNIGNQLVALNNPLVFTASIPCSKGYIYHEDGTGNFTLRGLTNNCFARYQLVWNGNVQIPEGGAVSPVGIAIAVNGEVRPGSIAIYSPTVAESFGNLSSTAIVTVPRGCCFGVSLRYVSGVTDGTTTPTPNVEVANSNLTISRIA